jgi:hypothetical protein
VGKYVEKVEILYMADVQDQNGAVLMGNRTEVPQKIKIL